MFLYINKYKDNIITFILKELTLKVVLAQSITCLDFKD